jgi:hypothetical protein
LLQVLQVLLALPVLLLRELLGAVPLLHHVLLDL